MAYFIVEYTYGYASYGRRSFEVEDDADQETIQRAAEQTMPPTAVKITDIYPCVD